MSNLIHFMLFVRDESGVSPMTHQFGSYSSDMTHFVLKTKLTHFENVATR